MTLTFALILTLLVLVGMAYDVTRFIIPNWLNAALVMLYPVWVLLSPESLDYLSALLIAVIVLFVGFGLYAARLLGAGDVKFLAACSLYTGMNMATAGLLLYMAILGGIFAMVLWSLRLVLKPAAKERAMPRIFTVGAPIPYGLAIAGSFLIVLWSEQMPGMHGILP